MKDARWGLTKSAVLKKSQLLLSAVIFLAGVQVGLAKSVSGLIYTYPAKELRVGESLGNNDCYVTLDGKTDFLQDFKSVRFGLRESTNQKYYLLGFDVGVKTSAGLPFVPETTTLAPAYQKTDLQAGGMGLQKTFFVPFENGYLRSAHFLLKAEEAAGSHLVIRVQAFYPEGVKVSEGVYKGQKYVVARYPDGAVSILWGSETLHAMDVRTSDSGARRGVEVLAEFDWTSTLSLPQYALSFAYSLLGGAENEHMLLNALFDASDRDAPDAKAHLFRVGLLLDQSEAAIQRYLDTTRLWTPDPVVNRGYAWAKVNQLRMQQNYQWGQGFSNNPPSDVVVGRDSYWYLSGSSYYAQAWSKKLLYLWYRQGLELSGKFIEYMKASRVPIFTDDYSLNINDNTPLLMIAAYRYYSLTGDRAFLDAVYPQLLNSANYILSQRWVGSKNHYGLVWCTSEEKFVRGLCGWRNAIQDYNLSGAVTEVNVECYQALLRTAELARLMGDKANEARLQTAALDLEQAIQQHLRARGPVNHFYCLNINPAGKPVEDMTSDLLFPVLEKVADKPTAKAIMNELFGPHFWAGSRDGAGGIRTVSSAQPGYQPVSNPANYGLLGGVWPNVALWAGKAAAGYGMPDLDLRALRGTFLLSERDDPSRYNVVPGEFPEYFNGNDLVQKGMPLSPFVPGIYIWSALEGLAGIAPHPTGLQVNPALPSGWNWLAVSRLAYRGNPVTLLADAKTHTLYTTAPLHSEWQQVPVPESLQTKFSFVSAKPAFWMVVPGKKGYDVLAASPAPTEGKLIERDTGRVLLTLSVPEGEVVKAHLPER